MLPGRSGGQVVDPDVLVDYVAEFIFLRFFDDVVRLAGAGHVAIAHQDMRTI